jgi:aminomethyltransferase
VVKLLNRALAGSFTEMKIGQCKYTLLLNEQGGVQDDMILMRLAETEFIIVINADTTLRTLWCLREFSRS